MSSVLSQCPQVQEISSVQTSQTDVAIKKVPHILQDPLLYIRFILRQGLLAFLWAILSKLAHLGSHLSTIMLIVIGYNENIMI